MIPNIAEFHPPIIHFTIALLFTGVLFRWVALTGRLRWTGPAATALLVVGALFTVAAVRSGDQAHGPAERVPGARSAVQEHEQLGERSRNIFLAVGALELLALAVAFRYRPRPAPARLIRLASGAVGLVGAFFLYEAAEHGGELVYSYAGGVGVRTGDVEDVERLLVAGLYHQSRVDRTTGRTEEAATLVQEMLRRRPMDRDVQLLYVESLIQDREDPASALALLDTLSIAPEDTRLRPRVGLLRAEALVAAGNADSARALLRALSAELPNNQRIKDRLAELDK